MTLEERISAWIDAHEDELLRDIARLVAVPSVKGEAAPGAPFGTETRRALNEAVALCREYGFETAIYGGAIATADYNAKPAALDILGHLDVVARATAGTATRTLSRGVATAAPTAGAWTTTRAPWSWRSTPCAACASWG